MNTSKDSLNFELNNHNFTAKVIKSPKASGNVIIPRSVTYQNQEFLITKIGKESFFLNTEIKSISFADDSELHTIEKNAFYDSKIEEIYLPSKLAELEEGWCYLTSYLKNISVSSNNNHFKFTENKYLLSKTNEYQVNFDKLIFARRDIEEAIIPNQIKIIGSFSFSRCNQLKSIDFQPNSQLKSIQKEAISCSQIETISLPSTIEELEEGWCFYSPKLTKIILSPLNPHFLYTKEKILIKKFDQANNDIIVFASRDIEEVIIPSCIKRIASNSFSHCKLLKKLTFSNDSHLESIGKEAFSYSTIDKINIPPSVTKIEEAAFSGCRLKLIEFPQKLKLDKIDQKLFNFSSIEKVSIPSKVTRICQNAFSNCHKLNVIEFSEDSELNSIEKNAFYETNLKSLFFASNVSVLEEGWCHCTRFLSKISVSPKNRYIKIIDNKLLFTKSDTKLEVFDKFSFACRDVKKVAIPSEVKIIEPYSFSDCHKLKTVEFSPDSRLNLIGKSSFHSSEIERIEIPSRVSQIEDDAFIDCFFLKVVTFSPNSRLCLVGDRAFLNTKVKNFTFPKSVTRIGGCCFFQSLSLESVEILSTNISIGSGSFSAMMKLSVVSFPNLEKLTIEGETFDELPEYFTLFSAIDISPLFKANSENAKI